MVTSYSRITLRPLAEPDEDFSYRVYARTRDEEMALVNWNAEQKEAFLSMQFNAQRTHYRQYSPQAEWSVIEADGTSAGRLIVDRSGSRNITLMDIALVPEFRGRGMGTQLIQALQAEAQAAGKSITLHVEDFNPAVHLYLRLGFRFTGAEAGIYKEMIWP